uniref:G_PROTEIN_RECEP_F1_2 domain-containing protein n=1 Tax=Parastrongyloides trichosuri TaxID=131310 RepID=A0A0N4ZFY3_PARTI
MNRSKKNPLQDSYLNKSAKQYVHSIFGESVNFFWFFGQIHVKWIFVWAQLFLLYIALSVLLDCSAGSYDKCSPIWLNLFSLNISKGATIVGEKAYQEKKFYPLRIMASFVFVLNCAAALFGMAALFSAEKVYNKKKRESNTFNIHPIIFAIPSYLCQGMWLIIYLYWTFTNILEHWNHVTFVFFRFFFISIIPYAGVWVMILYGFSGSLYAMKFLARAARHREVDPELTITMNQTMYSRRGYYGGDISMRSGRSDCSNYSNRSARSRRFLRSGKYRLANPTDISSKKSPNRSLLSRVRRTASTKHDVSNRTEKNLEAIEEEEVSNM